MDNFKKEVKTMYTEDIILILNDQQDLYTEEELAILKAELKSRPDDSIIKEREAKDKELEKLFEKEDEEEFSKAERTRIEKENKQRQKNEKHHQEKINNLKAKGSTGYYEYKVVSLMDESGIFRKGSGAVNTVEMTAVLNELGIDGWHLVTAYTNELGKNHLAGGIGGAIIGANATIDENILIFERFVKI